MVIRRTFKYLTAQSNKLRGVITDTAVPLGTTAHGSAWATKALHPADQITLDSGAPVGTGKPMAFLAFNNMYQIVPPAGLAATDTWACDVLTTGRDPLCFGSYATAKTGAFTGSLIDKTYYAAGTPNRFMNPQVAGSGATPEIAYAAKRDTFVNNVRKYRIAFAGFTFHMDAPALSNQGTVTATQYPVEDRDLTMGMCGLGGAVKAYRKLKVVPFTDYPDFAAIQNLPDVYSAEAKNGCYLPLKLGEEDFEMRAVANTNFVHGDWDVSAGGYVYNEPLNVHAATGVTNPLVPVTDVQINPATGAITAGGTALPVACTQVGHIAFRGLDPKATLYVYARLGFDIEVQPGSIYSPYVRNPVMEDDAAVRAYFAVSRQLKDAYPEEYNDLGEMFDLIVNTAADVLPALFPSSAPLAAGAKQLYKMIRGKSSKETKTEAQVLAERVKAVANRNNRPRATHE
jgi:hypothetical protein